MALTSLHLLSGHHRETKFGSSPCLEALEVHLQKLDLLATADLDDQKQSVFAGFLFGYDTGVISGALPYLRDDLLVSYTSDKDRYWQSQHRFTWCQGSEREPSAC